MKQPPLHQTITLSRFECGLWEVASILRGNPVDRAHWRSSILPLLFSKRTCDVWGEEHHSAVATLSYVRWV
jgi:hypothetical protein